MPYRFRVDVRTKLGRDDTGIRPLPSGTDCPNEPGTGRTEPHHGRRWLRIRKNRYHNARANSTTSPPITINGDTLLGCSWVAPPTLIITRATSVLVRASALH